MVSAQKSPSGHFVKRALKKRTIEEKEEKIFNTKGGQRHKDTKEEKTDSLPLCICPPFVLKSFLLFPKLESKMPSSWNIENSLRQDPK